MRFKLHFFAILLCFACSVLNAQQLTTNLRALVFYPSSNLVIGDGVTREIVEGIHFEGVYPPEQEILVNKLESYLGNSITKEELDELINEVILHYRDADFPVVDVLTPPQTIRNGIIQLVAIESRLDDLIVEGNRHFSTEQIKKFLQLEQGEIINQKDLNTRLDQLNKNAYRTVDISYDAGSESGTTTAYVKVDDQIPMKYTLAFEDTGNALTEDERISASFNWGDVFDTGHTFNYTYTGDPLAKYLKSHSAAYSINFPWGHDLAISANYARNGADLPDPTLNVSGKSWGGSLNYTLPIPSWIPNPLFDNYVETLTLGYNFSRSNNLLEFNQIQVSNTISDTSELKFTYSGTLPDDYGLTIFSSALTYSPGDTTGHNSDTELAASGASSANYGYILFNLNRITIIKNPVLENWISNATIQYQMASKNLPGGGKLGSGGYLTLPGYDEREANGDRGIILMADLTTPPFSPSSYFKKEWGDQMTGRFFWGYSDVSAKQANAATLNPNISMMSIGTGFRYNVGSYLSFRFDYGWQLKDSGVSTLTRRDANSRGHFSMSLSY